ncbi:MAG TPA: HAD family hydrolase [Nitrososphaerales archaeon]|nr:HAD family hydrolase [Nitrososphaerales archaeon]
METNFQARAVVFDLFSAVVDPGDFRPKDFNVISKIAEVFNLDSAAFTKYWDESAHIRNTSKSRKPLNLIEDYLARNNSRLPSKGDMLIADTLLGRYFDLALQNPKSEVVFALHNLKYQGLKLGALSNTNSREISTWFRSPLSGVFETTSFSCNIGLETPSKEAFNHILSRLGVSASSTVYVGGGEESMLKGAKDTGFGMVIFMEGFVAKHHMRSDQEIAKSEAIADATIQRISELEELLRPQTQLISK